MVDRFDLSWQPSLTSVHHHFWEGGRLAVPAPPHATDGAHVGDTTIDDDPNRDPVRGRVWSSARFNINLVDLGE
jgi:hypothetical protein